MAVARGGQLDLRRLGRLWKVIRRGVGNAAADSGAGRDIGRRWALAALDSGMQAWKKGLGCIRANRNRPSDGHVVSLFHPRRDRWPDHFVFEGVRISGISAAGRATVQVLNMNDARRLELRTEVLRHAELA